MRREICGECASPINDDGTCDCTELLKRGWRQCAVGQKTTKWCAIAETLLREQRQRDEDLLQKALTALKDIRSRSAMNLVIGPKTYELIALLAEIHHIADTALAEEKDNEQ